MRRRDFIAGLGIAAAAWPVAARGQPAALPIVALVSVSSRDAFKDQEAAFLSGLEESGYIDSRNVTIEYHWLEGRYDRIPALVADLVRRRVAVIATPSAVTAAVAAKGATTTIPIVFGVGEDPVKLGLIQSFAHPGGNATGVNFLNNEGISKRLGLLHQLVPKVTSVGVLINPATEALTDQLREAQNTGSLIGLSITVLKASTSTEIEEAFATLVRERISALLITGNTYFSSRLTQFSTLAARHGIAAAFSSPSFARLGGLMSYGTDTVETWHQVGTYTGRILKGAKPAELPVVQSTKFKFVINMQTARALGIEVSPGILSSADEVIE
jgi:putative ABC transport system substrate-binding protein